MNGYYGTIDMELKKAIIEWIIENINEFQITNECIKNFRQYIYDSNGEHLIGGEKVYNFINSAIELLRGF